MSINPKKNKLITLILLFLIISIGGFFRFYKLNWGNNLYTHPDEYHIVASVLQLSFPDQMHPHFFSYGTVTIYLIYFTKLLLENLSQIFPALNFQFLAPRSLGEVGLIPNPFLIGRFYSAFFSTLTIFIVFKICRNFFEKDWISLLAAAFVALTPGLIQQAHFATPESNLIFFVLGSMFFLIKFIKQEKVLNIILSSIFLGFALGIKISSIVFLFPIVLIILLTNPKRIKRIILLISVNFLTTLTTLAVVAPFIFLDYTSFKGNFEYEGGLAAGKFSVFYTRQFINTIPFIFQMEKILPYALGPAILILGLAGFISLSLSFIKKKSSFISLIIAVSFLSTFISNDLLFAKWTRFIAPSFPFFAIFSAYILYVINKKNKLIAFFLAVIMLITTAIWSLMFFSVYTKPDIRITASNWLVDNLPESSVLLTEEGNTIDIPLNGTLRRIGFNFYPFEEDKELRTRITKGFVQADYFIVQSRRIFMNHQRLPNLFPRTKKLYDALFSGQMGFKKIKEFNSYPALNLFNRTLSVPDENAEETWSVFDHPVIRVFKKTKQLTIKEYEKLF